MTNMKFKDKTIEEQIKSIVKILKECAFECDVNDSELDNEGED